MSESRRRPRYDLGSRQRRCLRHSLKSGYRSCGPCSSQEYQDPSLSKPLLRRILALTSAASWYHLIDCLLFGLPSKTLRRGACSSYVVFRTACHTVDAQLLLFAIPLLHHSLKSQAQSLLSPSLTVGFCLAQRSPDYLQFDGNSSGPSNVSPRVRDELEQADISPNANHTVRSRSQGDGE